MEEVTFTDNPGPEED